MAAAHKHKSSNDGVAGAGAGAGELELVAMRKDDSSWHPCKISLCSDKVGLNVEYVNNDSNDVISTREEALAQLRIRSTSLRGNECTLIEEGECVLAIPKSQSKDIFFEAEVEKRIHAQHSKKHCRCAFVVKWNRYACEGETAVLPLSAIMKMSSTCIDVHPTIVAFFNILTNPVCNFSPLPTLFEGTTDCEMDDFKLETEGSDCELDASKLDKQIEDISNSIAAFGVESPDKLVFGTQGTKENEHKTSQTPPVIKEVSVKSTTPVNPQAAVASFALKQLKFSGSPDCLSTFDGAKVLQPQPEVVEMSKGGTPYNVSFVNNSSNVHDVFITTEAAIAKYVPRNNNIVKKLFSTEEAAKDPRMLDASEWETKNEKFHKEFVDGVLNTAASATNDKLSKPSRTSRQHNPGVSCQNVLLTCITEPKLMPFPMRTRRLTRSAIREAEAVKINEKKPSYLEKDLYDETASTFTKKMGQVGNRGLYDDKDSNRKTCFVWVQTSNNSRRLTRSVACIQTENIDLKCSNEFEERRLPEILERNMTSESKASEGEDPITLPIWDGICPSRSAGRCEQVQKLALKKKIAQKTEGDAPTNHVYGKGVKRKTIADMNQQLQKSPCLPGFRPRTRSQVKSG